MASANQSAPQWFDDNVHVHDIALKSYLRQSFPAARHEIDDIVQESYLRVWRAHEAQPLTTAKAFLFKVARNVTLDFLRRRRVSPVEASGDSCVELVMEEKLGVVETVTREERVRALVNALADLSPRAREVVVLRNFRGLSQ